MKIKFDFSQTASAVLSNYLVFVLQLPINNKENNHFSISTYIYIANLSFSL